MQHRTSIPIIWSIWSIWSYASIKKSIESIFGCMVIFFFDQPGTLIPVLISLLQKAAISGCRRMMENVSIAIGTASRRSADWQSWHRLMRALTKKISINVNIFFWAPSKLFLRATITHLVLNKSFTDVAKVDSVEFSTICLWLKSPWNYHKNQGSPIKDPITIPSRNGSPTPAFSRWPPKLQWWKIQTFSIFKRPQEVGRPQLFAAFLDRLLIDLFAHVHIEGILRAKW